MSFVICSKHNKTEKTAAKVSANTYICMNPNCPNSFKVLCFGCKNEHKDHINQVISIEDATFLVDRLMTTPLKEVGSYVSESVDIMKKLKLIKEFRKKIDMVQKQIQKEALQLIDNTEQLIHQYAACKESVTKLHEVLRSIGNIRIYKQFAQHSHEMLSNLDYNFKKDKFQFSNLMIADKEEKRRSTEQSAKRKIQQVRDYSMKIIQVILHNDDSEQEENDITYRKKHYETLKQELSLENDEIELGQKDHKVQNSKSILRINKNTNNKISFSEIDSQTNEEVISKLEAASQLEHRISQLKKNHLRTENDLRLKLSAIVKEKQVANRELTKLKNKFEESKKAVHDIQVHLQENKGQRIEKQKIREQMVKKIMQLWQWKGSNSEDKIF